MKKFLSLIAVVATVCSVATSAFAAFSCEGQVTGATLKDVTATSATIEYDETNTDGFVFKFFVSETLSKSTTTVDVTAIKNAGWTIESIDGLYAFTSGYALTDTATKLTVKFSDGVATITPDDAVIQFKAVPGPDATIDGVTFKVSPMYNTSDGLYNKYITYTLAKAAPQEDKVTVVENGDGSLSVTGEGATTLAGKKILFKDATIADADTLNEDSRFVVTYDNGTPKAYNIFAAVEAEGKGAWSGKSVAFGIVYTGEYDPALFSFEIK